MNDIDLPAASEKQKQRIQIISRIFQTICFLLLLVMGFEAIYHMFYYWWTDGKNMSGAIFSTLFSSSSVDFNFPWWGKVFLLASYLLLLVSYWLFFRLFRLYQRCLIFTPRNVRCIKYLGIITVARWLFHLISNISINISNIPSAHDRFIYYLRLSVSPEGWGLFLWGVALFLIAWIMDEGRKIQEEQELTV